MHFFKSRIIAVYIDSLVMISIEMSETNKNRALEIQDKFVSDHDEWCPKFFLKGNFF